MVSIHTRIYSFLFKIKRSFFFLTQIYILHEQLWKLILRDIENYLKDWRLHKIILLRNKKSYGWCNRLTTPSCYLVLSLIYRNIYHLMWYFFRLSWSRTWIYDLRPKYGSILVSYLLKNTSMYLGLRSWVWILMRGKRNTI